MRVHIGRYVRWVGPYQIAEWLRFVGVPEKTREWVGGKLANTWLNPLCSWVYRNCKRKVVVKIDHWDTWNAADTLSLIILPLLRRFRKVRCGSAFVDNEDVPKHLHGIGIHGKNWDIDENFHKRWDYVLDEMIWTFEQLTDEDNEHKFFTSGFDREGYDAHQSRIANGLRLFGKYYRGLWD